MRVFQVKQLGEFCTLRGGPETVGASLQQGKLWLKLNRYLEKDWSVVRLV